jgi:hypothetical protein
MLGSFRFGYERGIFDEFLNLDQGFIGKCLMGKLISGISTIDPRVSTQESLGPRGPWNLQKLRKYIKSMRESINIHLGDSIKLNEIIELEDLVC